MAGHEAADLKRSEQEIGLRDNDIGEGGRCFGSIRARMCQAPPRRADALANAKQLAIR
jgi:hypothetical protein